MEPRLTPPAGGFGTRAVHGALAQPTLDQTPLAPPIVLASTWRAERNAELGALLEDDREGYVYGRYDTPTATTLHTVLASLHGGAAAWSFASGTAAILATLEVLRGDGRIVASDRLYGGTHALLERQSQRAGWDVVRADLSDVDRLHRELADGVAVVYVETIANPTTAVADLAALGHVCRDAGTALVVDNTFASPYLCRPLELGATAVVESATKYLAGHGDVVAGVVVGDDGLARSARELAYTLGASLGAFEAYLVVRGLQTLHLRVRASCANALAVAQALADADDAPAVHHPGLPTHPQAALVERQFGGRGAGGMVALDLGSRTRAEAFADACQVFTRAVSLGGTHSLVLHAASTTHRQLDERALASAGVGPGVVRLSVGIEDAADLVADAHRALAAAAAVPA